MHEEDPVYRVFVFALWSAWGLAALGALFLISAAIAESVHRTRMDALKFRTEMVKVQSLERQEAEERISSPASTGYAYCASCYQDKHAQTIYTGVSARSR